MQTLPIDGVFDIVRLAQIHVDSLGVKVWRHECIFSWFSFMAPGLMFGSITLIRRISTIKDNLCGLWNNERMW